MNWIDKIVDDHKEFESPLSFWRWAAIAAISATVKDNVWLERHIMKLYPNIYVMFHADSGLKKGPPVNYAARLVSKVNNTKIISGRSSIQGILKELGSQQAYSAPGGKIVKPKSVAFICSSELSSSIVEDPIATTILTDLYDRQYRIGEWRSLLKMETFDLVDPTITMLTATNAAHSESFFETKDVKGGYFARTFIIQESEENRINSLLIPPQNVIDENLDSLYLKELSKLSGPFQHLGSLTYSDVHHRTRKNIYSGEVEYFTPAGLIYEEWYHDFKQAIKGVKDPTGTLNRFGDTVLKVAMILSLARAPNLIISEDAMYEAIALCEVLVGNVRRATLGRTDQEKTGAERKTILLHLLMSRDSHSITRRQLNKDYWLQGSITEWDEVVLQFQEAGLINIISTGSELVYEMTPKSIVELTEFFQGKMKK